MRVWVVAALGALAAWSQQPQVILIILDGCRPDYVTPEVMPNVHAFGQSGVTFAAHHAVFPTLTRVNSPSIATGCYPNKHGLLGNSVYFPDVKPDGGMSTGNAENLRKVAAAMGGKLLTVPSLGEILDAQGKKLVAVSAGSSGSAFLLNHTVAGGGVINVDLILPESQRAVVEAKVGAAPAEATPNAARNHWAVDALLEYAIPELKPDAAIVWFSDPDHTAHEHGMGDPVTVESLKAVDAEVGRLLDGVGDDVNVIIGSDHGFSTNVGGGQLPELLAGAGFEDVVIVDGGIYVREGGAARAREIVALLQKTPWIGAIFTKPIDGAPLEGTLPLSAARWDHPRGADILVAPQWTDDANAHGFQGTTALPGVATHGNSSTWDIHNIGFAAGPAFKKTAVLTSASGNVDWAPTMLHLMGLTAPEHMDGRVLAEALLDGPQAAAPEKKKTDRAEHGTFEVKAQWTEVGGARYLDFVKGTRTE